MHVTCWTYPWDIARLGADAVLGDLADQGFNGVDLAATYHPISVLSPRGPHVSGFFSPSGAVHFPARPDRYGRIKPFVWDDPAVTGAWGQTAARADMLGLELNAWTIGLFQPWMAQQFPHVARVYPTGDRVDAGVCPSNRDMREYLAILAADMADQFPIHLVKLEGVHTPSFDYGWIRRRIYFTISAVQQRLLRVCFCAGCVDAATTKGIDVDELRSKMLAQLEIGSANADDPELLHDEAFVAYGRIADESAAALVAEVAAALRSVNTGAEVAVASPNEAGGPATPIDAIIDDVRTVLLLSVGENRDEAERTARAVLGRADPMGLEYMLHPPSTTAMGSVPMNINEGLDDPEWLADLRQAVDLGINRISVYNYGLLTDTTFRALAHLALTADVD